MSTEKALENMTDVIRRKHFALSTEQCCCGWLSRYCDFVVKLPAHISSEQKLERFLNALKKKNVPACIQNQTFNPRSSESSAVNNLRALCVLRG